MKAVLAYAIFAAALGMFQFGFNSGVINSPQKEIEAFINASYTARYDYADGLSEWTISFLFSLAVSAFLVGGMIGGLGAGAIADKFGRKRALMIVQAFALTGALAQGVCKAASSYELLFLGRLLTGLACGFFTGLVPLYITEIAPVNIRGGLGVVNQLAVTSGILTSQILGLGDVLGSGPLWPLLLAFGAVPSLLQCIMLPLLAESPRYLILTVNDVDGGRKALRQFRGTDDVQPEVDEIREEVQTGGAMSVLGLLRSKPLLKPLLICVVMHLSQQLSGIVAIFYYSTNFFIAAGIAEDQAQYTTVGVGAIMVTMTLVTLPLMDRLGRRTIHLSGLGGMFACSVLITIALNLDDTQTWVNVFLVVSTLAFVVGFAFGPGSIPWLITGELFTQGPRPAAIAVATLVNWSSNLAVGLVFPSLQKGLGNYTFLPFMFFLALFYVVIFIYLPETKGATVQEIQAVLAEPGPAGKFKRQYNDSQRSEIPIGVKS